MKWVKAIALVALFVGGSLFAQQGAYWFTLTDNPDDVITCLNVDDMQPGDQFTLHAWLSIDAPDWGWLGGFSFPISFDENYITMTDMTIDETVWANYMFHGVRWPGDTFGMNPGQAMWFASLCLSGCPSASGVFHVGTATFQLVDYPPCGECFTVIDTAMYPPSNFALIGDNTGQESVAPSWDAFGLLCTFTGTSENTTPKANFLNTVGPNPFRGQTTISFGLAKKGEVNISVYDASGRLVKTLVKGVRDAGTYTIQWNGTDNYGHSLASGTYFLRMTTNGFSSIKNLLILR